MTTIKSLLTLILLSCFVSTSYTQNRKVTIRDHRKNTTRSSTKVNKSNTTTRSKEIVYAKRGNNEPRKVMPAHKHVWDLNASGWRTPRPNELKSNLKQKAEYYYDVNLGLRIYKGGVLDYVRGLSKPKPIKLARLQENTEMLMKEVVSNHTVGKSGKKFSKTPPTMVSYFKNVNVYLFTFHPYMDHIIVTDTLFVPFARTGKATFIAGYQNQGWAHIKIIANCVVYRSPLMLNSMGSISTDFVFAANKYIFKSIYNDLSKDNIKPPLYKSTDGNKIYGFRNRMRQEERILLNRLYVYTMEEIQTTLNTFNNNPWKKDLILAEFQNYRFKKVDRNVLNKDTETKKLFDQLCVNFDAQYGDNNFKDIRDTDDFRILVEGEVSALPDQPFKYHSLPTKASLLPVNNQNTGKPTALGFLYYNTTSDSDFEFELAVNLSYDKEALGKAGKTLKDNGLVLQKEFPTHLAEIKNQALKINGRKMGEIIPSGKRGQNIKFKIEHTNDKLALYHLFTGPIEFEIEYSIKNSPEVYSQTIALDIDPKLLKTIDHQQILESFSTIEKSSLSEKIRLSCQLDRTLPDEGGGLNYVEVTLDIQFQSRSVSMGPYRLSSYSLENSNVIVEFLKYSKDYTVKVSGQAFYENGRRDIKAFSENSKIIVLDESIFK